MKKEDRWIAIKDYEGIYEVSSSGKVRSVERIMTLSTGRRMAFHGALLKPMLDRLGYKYVELCDHGSSKICFIHVLVAEHFVGERPSANHRVNHKDGRKWNNYYKNLEWLTQSENLKHAYDTGLRRKPIGENNPNYKHGKYSRRS